MSLTRNVNESEENFLVLYPDPDQNVMGSSVVLFSILPPSVIEVHLLLFV